MPPSLDGTWWWPIAAAATVIHCSAMAAWIPVRRFRLVYPAVVVGCGAAVVVMADLALYAFTLIGLTVGLLPTRARLTRWSHEINRGVTRERYDWPPSHLVFCVVCVVGAALAAMASTR
ncbi:hypothetical protein [Streptomyces sp. NPDC004435]|uniref:hypothetical protein n=1 Tax=Streptomyces sp. NPDC004435 TaxID=3364701 RepID=UPI0036BD25D2